MIGATIAGRYRLAALITQSRAGELYKAVDLTDGDPVTIQLLPPGSGAGSGLEQAQAADLAAAVAAMAPLNDPGILRPFAHGLDGGRPYLASWALEGSPLVREVALAPLSPERTIYIVAEIGRLLGRLHDHRLVHGDLSPATVQMIPTPGFPHLQLRGYGLMQLVDACWFSAEAAVELNDLAYAAPEQMQGGPPAVASDLYSLGAILYVLLTGQLPFAGDHPQAVLVQKLAGAIAAPSDLHYGLPASFDALLAEMLDPQPAQRPPDAAAVIARLRHIGQHDLADWGKPPRRDPNRPAPPLPPPPGR